jgi:hypothetical protein
VQSKPAIRGLGLAAPIGIPIVFLIFWVVVIVAGSGASAHPVY